MIGGTIVEHVLSAGIAGGSLYAFTRWRPALPWKKEVRDRRKAAKWRRKVFSFGRTRIRGKKIKDKGR